jgi:hypothetical protein
MRGASISRTHHPAHVGIDRLTIATVETRLTSAEHCARTAIARRYRGGADRRRCWLDGCCCHHYRVQGRDIDEAGVEQMVSAASA